MNITLNRLSFSQQNSTGGFKWVFKQNSNTATPYFGGALSGDKKAGDVIFAGDFAFYDHNAPRRVYHLNQFVLAQDLAAGDTEVYFYNTTVSHTMRTDMFVTPEPDTATSTGPAVACTSLVKTTLGSYDVYKLTITAGALGTGSVGDVFVEANEAGADVAPKITQVNCVIQTSDVVQVDLADVQGESGKGQMTLTPYYHCTLYTPRVHVPKIAPENKCPIDEFYEL